MPVKVSRYFGKQYYRFHVRVTQSGLDRELWSRHAIVPVISHSPVAAVRLVREEFAPLVNDPTEFECLGPKGGVTHRYVGYEGLIMARMWGVSSDYEQLKLQLV